MPYQCIVDATRRLVSCRAYGVFSERDVFESQPRVRADPAFDPSFNQLVDLTDATELDFNYRTMSAVATTSIFSRGVRRAIVARTPVQYGVARMFQALSESSGQIVALFDDRGAAEAWLEGDAPSP